MRFWIDSTDKSGGLYHQEILGQSFPECQFIQADIYELPDTDMLHSFDIVLAVEIIEHLLYPKELAKTAKKCLKPGGQSILDFRF